MTLREEIEHSPFPSLTTTGKGLRTSETRTEAASRQGLARTSHYLLETLRYLVEVDPAEVFLLMGEVVSKSTVDAYHYESLAADLIVGVVERYLADYRDVFVNSKECQQVLVQLLETFVSWPEVGRLGFRLGEVFR